jgi:Tfp pilus assembly protein PilW
VIELLLVAGLIALGLLLAIAVLFVLHRRRQGTVRAVFMPRRKR